MQLRNEDRS